MRQTPVDDYLEEISTELPEELYGNLSDAIYETVCEFDEEVAQLKAENAKLREERREYQATIDSLVDECADHKAENAKLRELAHAAWKCIHTGASCSDCRMIAGGCTLQTAMRELGIEVES